MIKLNERITYREVEDSILIITPWDNALHTLEDTGKLIFELLLEGKNKTEILKKILNDYEVESVNAEKDLNEFINSLLKKEIFTGENNE